jgi:hypothetical protein
MERLTNLKRYLQTLLPNTRERHAMLEIVGILEELIQKESAPQEVNPINETIDVGEKPKRGRKPSVSLGNKHGS